MIRDYKVCCVAVDPAIGENLSELIPGDKCKYAFSPPPMFGLTRKNANQINSPRADPTLLYLQPTYFFKSSI